LVIGLLWARLLPIFGVGLTDTRLISIKLSFMTGSDPILPFADTHANGSFLIATIWCKCRMRIARPFLTFELCGMQDLLGLQSRQMGPLHLGGSLRLTQVFDLLTVS
jgi:hypothetical protein